MNPILLGGLIGGGGGLLKHLISDMPAYNRKLTLAAETARHSPWTGMRPEVPDAPSMLGGVIQGGATGAMMGSNLSHQGAATDYLKNVNAKPGMYLPHNHGGWSHVRNNYYSSGIPRTATGDYDFGLQGF